jgi:putative DNA primase/helicase
VNGNGRNGDGLAEAVREHVTAHAVEAYERVLGAPPASKSGGATGEFYWHCPFHHPDRDPDFRINPAKGATWFCNVCNFGGDIFDLVKRLDSCEFNPALQKLADCFGLNAKSTGKKPTTGKKSKAADQKPKPQRTDDAAKHTALAANIWSDSSSAARTPTEQYLRTRGITADVPPSIRHHPALRHPSGQELPAMVTVVQDSRTGDLVAIHRTFLKPDGSGKADVNPQKMALGPIANAAARFAIVTDKLAFAEGVEDALTIQEAKEIPCRATLGGFRREATTVADSVCEVYLCADRDPSGVSERHARLVGAQLLAKKPTLRVYLTQPQPKANGGKVDFNDVLKERGHEGVREEFDAGLEELQPGVFVDQPPAPYSDIALSNDFADSRSLDLRYVKKNKEFLIYHARDTRWAFDETMVPLTWAKEFLTSRSQDLYEEVFAACILAKAEKHEAARQARAAARTIASKSKVAAVMDLVRSHPAIPTTLGQFDKRAWELNVPGSQLVDLKTGQLREARLNDYFTKVAAVAPDPLMPTLKFDQFIRQVMGSEVPVEICKCASCITWRAKNETAEHMKELHLKEVEKLVEYLLRLYGYALTADTRTPLLVIQIGEGGNGKGVLNDFVSQRILGLAPVGYSCEIPIEYLLDRKTDQHPTGLMNLFHARLALARESEMGTRWNEGTVKRLTGSDVISARRMREDFTDFLPSHKLIVFGQHKPALRGAHEAAWKRRVHMIPFPQKWDCDEDKTKHVLKMNEELADELAGEAPGVLHKLIQAVGRYHKNKRDLAVPDTVRMATSDYLSSQDMYAQWIAEEYDLSDPNATSILNAVFANWAAWAEKNKAYIGSRSNLIEALERFGVKVIRSNAKRGICLGIAPKQQSAAGGQEDVAF